VRAFGVGQRGHAAGLISGGGRNQRCYAERPQRAPHPGPAATARSNFPPSINPPSRFIAPAPHRTLR
jgi:hypothetical protein